MITSLKTFLSSLSFLLIFVTVYSCSKKNSMEQATGNLPLGSDTVKTYLALGDSYTIGQSVPEADRFPNQTVALLRAAHVEIKDPKIIATTGWTTENLINGLKDNPPGNNYSVVSLLIGVNNQYQHRSIDEYKSGFRLLLNRAIEYSGNNKGHVFVLSIPDYSVTPFAQGSDTATISREIDLFNAANKSISQELGVNYLDITPISREAATDTGLLAGDGLHPSGKQYKRWADILAPLMKKAL